MIKYKSWFNISNQLFDKLRKDGKMTMTDTRVFVYYLNDGDEVTLKQTKRDEFGLDTFQQFKTEHNGDVSFIDLILDMEKFAKESKLTENEIYSAASIRDDNIIFSLTHSLDEFRIEPMQNFICVRDDMSIVKFVNVRHKRFLYLCYDFVVRIVVNDRTAEYRSYMKHARKRHPAILMTEAIREVLEYEIRNYLRIKADFYPTDIGLEHKTVSFK